MHGESVPRTQLSRRKFLTSIPVAVVGAGCTVAGCGGAAADRKFGLSMTGVEIASVAATIELARRVGRSVDVLNFYDAFAWDGAFPTELVTAMDRAGCTPEITWEPWHPHRGVTQPDYSLAQIAGGRFDTYIARWAEAAARYDNRILLRFAHEMNGDWYPWSVLRNGGSPELYVAAYRRVHRIFGYAGATKVDWVWSPNVVVAGDEHSLLASYPGDDVVDIVGLDGYNFGNDAEGRSWTDPSQLFGHSLQLLKALAPSKPVWINEIGSTDLGGNKAGWISDAVEYLESTPVAGLMWFEVAASGSQDWRLTATRETSDAATSALATW